MKKDLTAEAQAGYDAAAIAKINGGCASPYPANSRHDVAWRVGRYFYDNGEKRPYYARYIISSDIRIRCNGAVIDCMGDGAFVMMHCKNDGTFERIS